MLQWLIYFSKLCIAYTSYKNISSHFQFNFSSNDFETAEKHSSIKTNGIFLDFKIKYSPQTRNFSINEHSVISRSQGIDVM